MYLVLVAVVFGVNLMPAFGPPTWAVLVVFKLNWGLNAVALVLAGAVSAGAGRYWLAWATRKIRTHLPQRRVKGLEAVGERLRRHRAGSVVGLALFAVSPVPSAQLFEAAGLIDAPLFPLTAAFFVGRLVSYSLYVGGASAAQRNFGDVFRNSLTSPWGIALQIAMLVGIVVLARVDWAKHLGDRAHTSPGQPSDSTPS